MSQELQTTEINPAILQNLVLSGDLSKMNEQQKMEYYTKFCQSLGLNPLTQPFQLINFQGKQRMYATKDCTEQLRKIHGVSIIEVTGNTINGVYIATAKAEDKHGKTDVSTGAVFIEGQKGEALANALMKAETKAKRRVTLSICGLGMLDESETDSIPGAVKENLRNEPDLKVGAPIEVQKNPNVSSKSKAIQSAREQLRYQPNGDTSQSIETPRLPEMEKEAVADAVAQIKTAQSVKELTLFFNGEPAYVQSNQEYIDAVKARREQLTTVNV